MSEPIVIVIEDDGWFAGKIMTDEGETDIRLDIYEACNRYMTCQDKHPDNESEIAEAWGKWLTEEGVPKLSHRGAFKLASMLFAERKKWLAQIEEDTATEVPNGGNN